jgi:hypothetical protein
MEEFLAGFMTGPQTSNSATADRDPSIVPPPALSVPRLRIGELLVEAKLLTQAQVDDALRKQLTWGSRLGDIVLAMGWVKPLDFYRVLARHFELEFVNLIDQLADQRSDHELQLRFHVAAAERAAPGRLDNS